MKNIMYLILSQVLLGGRDKVDPNQKREKRQKGERGQQMRGSLRQEDAQIEIIAQNLEIPWGIEIGKEGKIYFTERPGKIRVIENGVLRQEPLYTFEDPFITFGEGGLMGIVLDPNHEQNGYIYVMHSYTQENEMYNRVVRLVEEEESAYLDRILIDEIPGARIHNGGRIKIGPDGKLYITTGDAAMATLAQDPASLAGKILRIELDGSIPADNPFFDSPVYTLGHRNPQGLAWNEEGVMYASEHGQIAYDEINIIESGNNYGWPILQGDEQSDEIEGKVALINSGTTTWAPAGMTVMNQGPWDGELIVANLRGQQLLAITLDETGRVVENVEMRFKDQFGRIRDVIQADDGNLYILTNNTDGRGTPDETDDKIIRIIPAT